MKKRNMFAAPHYQQNLAPVWIDSIEDTYSFACRKESDTLGFYSNLASLDNNPYTKTLFNFLSHLQQDHISFIEKKLTHGCTCSEAGTGSGNS
jgi:rubrerythrin